MVVESCSFQTSRLLAKEWQSLSPEDWAEQDLGRVVAKMLTEPVTRALPAGWQGAYSKKRARHWIEERDREGTTLLVITRSEGNPVGLLLLFEVGRGQADSVDLRLGYLLAEAAWGQGLATELLNGLVAWCKQNPVASIVGGVDRDNAASQRVLEKAEFVRDPDVREVEAEELLFRLQLIL